MNNPALLTVAIPMLFVVTACDHSTGAVSNQTNGESAHPSVAPPGGSSSPTPNGVTAPARVTLSKYVGKHPSEAVDGRRFLDEPAVRAAVASVPDNTARNFAFDYNGPDAPIVLKEGRVLAWGCERHNCGYHNWSISISPDGRTADVCYYDNDDSAEGPSTWYLADGKTEKRPGNCPSD